MSAPTNNSLRKYSPDQLGRLIPKLREQKENCSAWLPAGTKCVAEGPRIKFVPPDGSVPAAGSPANPAIRLGLQAEPIIGFIDPASLKLSLKTTLSRDSPDALALRAMFGPDSFYAQGLVDHSSSICPGKKKKKPSLKDVNAEMERTAGRPEYPQPLKPRMKKNASGEETDPVYEFGMTIYLAEPKSKERNTADDVDGLPAEIAAAGFPADHPVALAFMNNRRVPKEPRFTTADDAGRPSGWEILKEGSYPSPTVGYMFRAFATQTIGGFTVSYNDENKLFMLSMYANGPGVMVFALPEARGAAEVQSSAADMDAYAAVLGPAVQTKRAYDQVAEPGDDDGNPAKRSGHDE